MKPLARFAAMALGITLAVGSSHGALAQDKGGIINVATIGEPPTLDPMASTADLVGIITQHFFETLYTFDKTWKVIPLLAEGMPEISPDGRTYTIKLRTGIKFHDDSDMTAEDVVASLNRWMKISSRGKQTAGFIDSVSAMDAANVKIVLKQPYAPLTSLLALNNSAAVIMPLEKQADDMKEFVGTGPYMLKERKADQYIQLVRFDGYKSRDGESDGYGGARHQYLDEIRFVPVPDASTRVEAAIAGQFDFVDGIPTESLDRVKSASKSHPVIIEPYGYPVYIMNTVAGPTKNPAIRKAIRQALNMEDLMAAAFGNPKFYSLEGSVYPSPYPWFTDAGVNGNYNTADPEAAAVAAKAAGYNGEPIRILTTRQYEFLYKTAQVAAEYLKMAGFTVDLQVVDWATLTQRRADPKVWEIFTTFDIYKSEPALIGVLSKTYPGWWDTPESRRAISQFNAEVDPAKRVPLWASVQQAIYDEVPMIKLGNFNSVVAVSNNLNGVEAAPWPYFWNASIAK